MTHICVSKLTIIGSDNGLSPGRRQAIIWTNAGLLLIRPLVINFSEIFIKVHQFLFEKISLKMSSGKWCLFYLGLNELNVTRINFSCAELISGDINMSYIVFFYHFLTVRCCRYLWLKSFFVKDKNLLILYYRQVSNISRTKSQHLKDFRILSCSFLCRIPWSQMSSREWRCTVETPYSTIIGVQKIPIVLYGNPW